MQTTTQAKPNATTLGQDLRNTITELDNIGASDDVYRERMSTLAKRPLAPNETYRQRLLRWCEREEAEDAVAQTLIGTGRAPTPEAEACRQHKWYRAYQHWLDRHYRDHIARALASCLHGENDDVRQWADNIRRTQTSVKTEHLV